MLHKHIKIIVLALLTTMTAGFVLAQTAPEGAPTQQPPAPANGTTQLEYRPNMADLMTMMVQPRHIKLGLAGKAQNWVYAAYEANELRNALTRITRTLPIFENTDTAATIASTIQQPLADTIAAAKAHDAKAFNAAYAQMTQACNVCHLSHNKPHIVIKVPDGAMFPDQDFVHPAPPAAKQ